MLCFYFYAIHFPNAKVDFDHFFYLPFFPTFSFLLSMSYSYCFCWLSLSFCGCFVAKLEPAVNISSSVQTPVALWPHDTPQVLQPSSLPLGPLVEICTCVINQSVRPAILYTPTFAQLILQPCRYL